jgi:hypothetical protein
MTMTERPWRIQKANGRESGGYASLDNALRALLDWTYGRIMDDPRRDRGVRIIRKGWSGCLVPAGKVPGDGVRIEPLALDGSEAAPADRDKWIEALSRTFAWHGRPRERPLVPGDPDAMELWNDTH